MREREREKRLAMENVKEISEIRALKILSAAQNNESSWPISHC